MFSWFIEGVEALDSLIGKPRKRDRFVEVVLAKTEHYAEGKVLFRSFSATLYRERWGEVASYLRQAWPLLRFLRQFWDQVAYESGDSEREDQANLAKLTKLLRDDVFFVYWQIQMNLRDVIQKLLHWAEGCACHRHLHSCSHHMREKFLRKEISCPEDVACTCPMMGCRGPELAAGQLDVFAQEVFHVQFHELVMNCGVVLQSETWASLRQEWFKGGAFIRENLKIRLGFYEALPWVILGGAHPDEETAKSCLKKGLDLWDALRPDAVALQHKLASDLFKAGPLRQEPLGFLASDDVKALQECPLLEAFLAPLSFVQVAERIIEGAHKDLGPIPKHGGMSALSIQLRAPQLTRCLELEPACFGDLVDAFVECQKIKKFTEIFPGYASYPDLKAFQL